MFSLTKPRRTPVGVFKLTSARTAAHQACPVSGGEVVYSLSLPKRQLSVTLLLTSEEDGRTYIPALESSITV